MPTPKRRRCHGCRKLTEKWQSYNGGVWHCYDGCYSTTGYDRRTVDGTPLWEGGVEKKEEPRMILGAVAVLFMACMIGGGLAAESGVPAHSKAMAKVVADYKPPC
jgi:hypothetical protein